MRNGLPGSLRETHTDASTRTPSRFASQYAPASWHKLTPEFGASKHTLVNICPVSVRTAAAPA